MKKLKLLGWNMEEVNKFPSFKMVETYQPKFPQIVDPIAFDNDNAPFVMVTCERTSLGTVAKTKLEFSPVFFTYQEIEE